MPSQDSKTCSVVRLAEREDMTTDDGYRFAQSAVNSSNNSNMVFVRLAIPCTGGSPWHNSNTLFLGGEEQIQGHLNISKAVWKTLVMFVEWLHSICRRWRICMEWLKNCAYWNWKEVRLFLANGIYKKFVSMVVRLV